MTLPDNFDLADFVRRVFAEDMGEGGDVTSAATIPADARFTAEMNCRQPIVVAGLEIAAAFFRELDGGVHIDTLVGDGDAVDAGTVLMRLEGMRAPCSRQSGRRSTRSSISRASRR